MNILMKIFDVRCCQTSCCTRVSYTVLLGQIFSFYAQGRNGQEIMNWNGKWMIWSMEKVFCVQICSSCTHWPSLARATLRA